MKLKKTIISTIIIATFSIATSNDYLVIIKKADHKYDVIENSLWEDISPTYTEWLDTDIFNNCNTWNPLILQQQNNFNQTASCDVRQERTINNRQQNTVDLSIKVISTDIETKTLNKFVNRDITVSNNQPIEEKTNYNCESWTPESSTVYSGTSFAQERYCDVDMMQKWNYHNDSSLLGIWEERYTEQTGYETQNIVGTKSWESQDSTYTAWADTGVLNNCGLFLPSISQQTLDFTQSRNCDYAQERTRTDKEINPVTGEINIISVVTETQNENKINNRNIDVTNDSPLIEKDNYNCSVWSPSISSTYIGQSLEQQRNCDKDIMRKWTYSLNGSNVQTWEERYTETTNTETQNVIGTMRLNNCSQILAQGYSTGNGVYPISTPLGNIDALCEMTIDGGGWTLVSYGGDITTNKAAITGYVSDRNNRSKMVIDIFGTMDVNAPTTKSSFSRFDYFKDNVKSTDEFLFKSTSSKSGNMIIFPVVNNDWFGKSQSDTPFTITEANRNIPYLKMTKTGDNGWKTVSNGTKWTYVGRSSDSYPAIDWNVAEALNCDNCGLDYENGLNHRSLIYWETNDFNGDYTGKQWFHASSLTLKDSTSPINNFRDAEFWYREK